MLAALKKLSSKTALSEKTPDQLGNWYLDQAMEFEKSKTKAAMDSKTLAWRCVVGTGILMAVVIISSAIVVFVNKPNPPGVLRVNDTTGEVTILKTLADGKIKYGQATDIKYLRDYVNYRESYDWETIQDLYNATILLSSPREGTLYAAFNGEGNKLAPVNVLKDKYRVIAKAGTISFVGKTALVSFTKKTIPLTGLPPTTDYFVATISYEYEDTPMDDKDRGINVAGFKVTSYRVDRDITKASSVALEGVPTSATSQPGASVAATTGTPAQIQFPTPPVSVPSGGRQ